MFIMHMQLVHDMALFPEESLLDYMIEQLPQPISIFLF